MPPWHEGSGEAIARMFRPPSTKGPSEPVTTGTRRTTVMRRHPLKIASGSVLGPSTKVPKVDVRKRKMSRSLKRDEPKDDKGWQEPAPRRSFRAPSVPKSATSAASGALWFPPIPPWVAIMKPASPTPKEEDDEQPTDEAVRRDRPKKATRKAKARVGKKGSGSDEDAWGDEWPGPGPKE